jgi:hypothetical protein
MRAIIKYALLQVNSQRLISAPLLHFTIEYAMVSAWKIMALPRQVWRNYSKNNAQEDYQHEI